MGAVSAATSPLSAPEPLRDDHDLEQFQCGIASLDDWLKRRARAFRRVVPLTLSLSHKGLAGR